MPGAHGKESEKDDPDQDENTAVTPVEVAKGSASTSETKSGDTDADSVTDSSVLETKDVNDEDDDEIEALLNEADELNKVGLGVDEDLGIEEEENEASQPTTADGQKSEEGDVVGNDTDKEEAAGISSAATTKLDDSMPPRWPKLPSDPLEAAKVFGQKRYGFEKSKETLNVGINMITEEQEQKRRDRASRFGITVSKDKINDRRKKFGFTGSTAIPICFEPRKEPAADAIVRPEAMLVHGLDNMSTKDIKTVFAEYNPSHIEWINLSSAAVVWKDEFSCSRALWSLGEEIPFEELLKTRGKCTQSKDSASPAESAEASSDNRSLASGVAENGSSTDGESASVKNVLADDAAAATDGPAVPTTSVLDSSSPSGKADLDQALNQADDVAPSLDDARSHENPLLRWRLVMSPSMRSPLLIRSATTKDHKKFGAKKPPQYTAKFGRKGKPAQRESRKRLADGLSGANTDQVASSQSALLTRKKGKVVKVVVGSGAIDRKRKTVEEDVSPRMRLRLGPRVDPAEIDEDSQSKWDRRMYSDGRQDEGAEVDGAVTHRGIDDTAAAAAAVAVAQAAAAEEEDLADYESEEEPEEVIDDDVDDTYFSREIRKGKMYSDTTDSDTLVPAWS